MTVLNARRSLSRIVVLDVDGAITRQAGFIDAHDPIVIPARDLHDRLRYWSSLEDLAVLEARVREHVPDLAGTILLYGSSDFHNLTYLWIRMQAEPVTIIDFDNHTDWVRMPPRTSVHAGSWVTHALDLPHVPKVMQVGVDGDMRVVWTPPTPTGPMTHDFGHLARGTVETFPYAMADARYFGRVEVPAACGTAVPGPFHTRVRWNTVRAMGIEAVMRGILDRTPTEKVYVTIDKDVLREADSFTNFYDWQQGGLSLDELTTALRMVEAEKTILAMDVNGDASRPSFGPGRRAKRLFALKDRRLTAAMFADPALAALNERSNLRILEALRAG